MTGVHAACTGCYELIPTTPGQLFGAVLVLAVLLLLFGLALAAATRYNR